MKKIIAIIIFSFPVLIKAQNYNVSLIPDSLLQNADAVLRFEDSKILIHSPKSATYKHKYAITILKESGDEYTQYVNHYDKFDKLTDVVARLYDATGKLMKTVKKREMDDIAYEDRITLFRDARVKKYQFYNKSYPFTVEFEEEEEMDGIFQLPVWDPIESENFSVQQSNFSVEVPTGYKIHYKLLNTTAQPKIMDAGNKTFYQWEVKNIKAIEDEPLMDDINNHIPGVYITPSNFEIGGYKGNMDSWNDLGKFIVELNKGRDELPDNVKQQVHQLTDNLSSVDEKIKVLYNYMQQNTHYVLVTLGMGGWQPFDANYVAQNKYGDCKALSNYMVSLLKEAKINAKYVLVTAGAGKRGLWPDFPAPYFNHAIMCVPNGKDTTWLECTSQTESAGFMGTFTGDRDVLLIDDDGGHVVHTPIYSAKNNLESRKVNASIDENGNLVAEIFTKHCGTQQELQHSLIHDATNEQREKYLNSTISLPTYKVERSDYKEIKGKIPVVDEYLKITSPNYASVSGKRLFVQPNLFNKASKLTPDAERKFDIKIKYSYLDIDSIDIKIPANYKVESMPKDQNMKNKFGEYKISYQFDGTTIHLVRLHEENTKSFPASEFSDLVNFRDAMYKADRAKIVFVKQTE
ncbi:transglutaminase-like superfamily protein [mine drainage metagenome]|uniref:Transglutaminase-like superfamily protein n=1 Tax=mine drainage metagenome TaxID=410659 RepID=A0A1J5SX40_9ZZZZ